MARKLLVLRGATGIDFIRAAAEDVPVEELPRKDLDALADGMVHQGVLLDADPLPLHKAETWARAPFPDDAIVVILDGIEDPHNFGAIIRSAAACGARGVVFGKDRAAPLSPAAVKSAAGGVEYVDLVQAANLVRSLELLKEAGFWLAALDAEAPRVLWEADLKGRIGLIVGGEGKGIRRLVQEHCDLHLRIPLTGPVTSLNVSVSAAIALAECLRQRAVP